MDLSIVRSGDVFAQALLKTVRSVGSRDLQVKCRTCLKKEDSRRLGAQ